MFRTSIAYSWSPSFRVSYIYWYYGNYGFKICVILFSFYSVQLLSWLFCSGPKYRYCNSHFHMWVRYIDTKNNTVACMSLLLLSIDLRLFCHLIMFYFELTDGAMVKWWMLKLCNGEIKMSIGSFVSHKYWICSVMSFSDTTFLQQRNQSTTFNILSLTTSTAKKFML